MIGRARLARFLGLGWALLAVSGSSGEPLRSPRPGTAAPGSVDELVPGQVRWLRRGVQPWSRTGWLRFATTPDRLPQAVALRGRAVQAHGLVLEGSGAAVIILPHLVGTARLPEYLLRRFGAAGYQAIALFPEVRALREGTEAEDLVELLEDRIRAGRAAVRHARDAMGAPCIVIVGVSAGAISAIPVAGLEDRIRGVVAMLGGGDLEYLAAHSQQPELRKIDWTAAIPPERVARIDPLTWAPELSPDSVLLIRALWDRVIPERASGALHDALRAPVERIYPSGHDSFRFFLPLATGAAIAHADARCRTSAQLPSK